MSDPVDAEMPAWENARKALNEIKGKNENGGENKSQGYQYPSQFPMPNMSPNGNNRFYNPWQAGTAYGGFRPFNAAYPDYQMNQQYRMPFYGSNQIQQFRPNYNQVNNLYTSFNQPGFATGAYRVPMDTQNKPPKPPLPTQPPPPPPPSTQSYADIVKNKQTSKPSMTFMQPRSLRMGMNQKPNIPKAGIRFNIGQKNKLSSPLPTPVKEERSEESLLPPGTETKPSLELSTVKMD
uniref:Uncharacterized protein n=1 Tax=Ciona savignyi TaxID=51511 RepID=H2YWI7_CIOSA